MISVGLELTGTSIKVAVVEGSAAKPKLKAFVTRKIDARKGEAEDDIVSVLKEVFKEAKAPKTGVVASIRAQDCMIREITVPFTADDKIRKTVKYQAENYFTSLSIDDLIIEYSKFAEAEDKSKLLVAGIKKSHVARRLELLEEIGVDPQSIDLDVAALFNTYAHLGAFEDVGAALIVEVKSETLKVGVVEHGKLRLARAIRMRLGSMKLDTLTPKSMGMPSGAYPSQADESARLPVVILDEDDDEHFSLEDSGITEVEREGLLHRVFMEIDRTVATVHLETDIDKIYLTGSSCVLDGIEEVFTEHFEIEAVRLDIGAKLGGKSGLGKKSVSIEGGTAVGLALKGLGIDHAGMDFRQEEFGYRGAFAQVKKGMACLLTLMFAFTFLYAYGLKQERGEKSNRTDSVIGMQRHLYTVLFPDVTTEDGYQPLASGGNNFATELGFKRDELANKYGGGGGGGQGPTLSSLEILRHFSRAKSQVSPRFQLKVMQVTIDPKPTNQSTFIVRTSEEFGTVMLERKFKGHPVLIGKPGRIRALKAREGSGFQFEFIVKIRKPSVGP
ncbi:MAG: pilus assembly protein PilM [Planctomycetes bacterium]|nr:pilus assembly protein PilM [Planctomycetota bacterium]